MIQFVKKVFKFIAILVIAAAVLYALFGVNDNADKYSSINISIVNMSNKSKKDSLDILFVGNSYCYSSVNPSIFELYQLKTYNLGLATAGPLMYELAINDYLMHSKIKPESVYLLVSPMTFSAKSDNFSSYPIHRYLDDELSHFELVTKFDVYGCYPKLLKQSIKKGIKNLVSKTNSSRRRQLAKNKGYHPSSVLFTDSMELATKSKYAHFKNDKFIKASLDHLIKIASNLKQQGIKVVFFEVPTNSLQNYFSKEFMISYFESSKEIKQKFEYVEVRDVFKSKHYRNIDHMNSNGANVVSNELVKYHQSIRD